MECLISHFPHYHQCLVKCEAIDKMEGNRASQPCRTSGVNYVSCVNQQTKGGARSDNIYVRSEVFLKQFPVLTVA